MEVVEQLLDEATGAIPAVTAALAAVLVIWLVRTVMDRQSAGRSGQPFRRQVTTLILSFIGLLIVVLLLPVSEGTIGQLLSLIGLVLSAVIALSATTFVGNVMAGLMLRAVRNFRSGDFIRVGDHFGRVSDRGLFHVEIQTEDRDLTTLPNLYLVTNPVRVVRHDGTLVTAQVSLGYDVPRATVMTALTSATADAGLEEGFVHVVDLGDFAITYRVAGLLTEVKGLLSTRSRLREAMLDHLHRAGIEIVSPTFMNQRVLTADRSFVPPVTPDPSQPAPADVAESVAFDKADEAESLEKLRERHATVLKEIEDFKDQKTAAESPAAREQLDHEIEVRETRAKRLMEYIKKREEEKP